MFPDPDYPKPVGSFPVPVAIPETGPLDGDQVCIQFSKAWLPFVLGCLMQLELSSTWSYTTDEELATAKNYADVLIDAFMKGEACMSSLMFRNCSSPGCGLEYSTDGGDTWTCIDLASCIETIWDEKLAQAFDDGVLAQGGGQPAPTNNPPLAACQTFHVQLAGNQQWHLPFPLQYGDSLQLLDYSGGWCDGSLAWYCPTGYRYLLGICDTSLYTTDPADPMPAQYHMGLVMNVGGTWYIGPSSTPFVQNSGTTPLDVFFQANDGSLSDNTGSIEFTLQYCRSGTVGIVYNDGSMSGPANCQVGDTISMTGRYDPYGACGHFSFIWAKFDQPVKLTVVSVTDYLGACDPSNSMYAFNNSSGWDFWTGICTGLSCNDPTGTVHDPCRQFWIDSHTSGGDVVVQVKVEAPT